MHPDLVPITNLWRVDAEIDQIRAEHEGLVAAVTAAQRASAEPAAVLARCEPELARLRQEERAAQRELDAYVERKARTQRLIDTGTAPDYAAATRQVEQCARFVDEWETRVLELMEGIDGLAAEEKDAVEKAAKAAADLGSARAALGARDGALRAALKEQLERREERAKELPGEFVAAYTELRRKKRPVVVNTREGFCETCRTKIPTQRLVEVQLARALHTCPGCSAWVLP
jgi:predicted  nucleic acid-binding Zn-ribbon protein